MSSQEVSARRYAEAIFDLGIEGDTLSRWSTDLETIADFVSEPDVAGILGSGRIPAPEKLRLLAAGLESSITPQAMNLVRLLAGSGKTGIAPLIRLAFHEKYDAHRGIAHATVTTAVPLSEDERTAIAARLSQMTGKHVDVTPVVDESIIGGVVARIGDQLIDGSTRTRLQALKRRLAGAAR